MFNEYYVGGGTNNYLLVNIPIVSGGGTERYYTPPSCDPITGFCSPSADFKVGFQNLSVSPSGAPSAMTTQFNTVFNSGLNVSGSGPQSDSRLAKFAYSTACTCLPHVGYGCWALDTFLLYSVVTNAYEGHAGSSGNSPAYQKFQTSAGSYTRNLFTSQALVTVKIPRSAFMFIFPLDISATNLVGGWSGPNLIWLDPGATATVRVYAIPGVTLTGMVTACGVTLQDQEVVIAASSTNYHVKTNSAGIYRFIAQPNTAYTITSAQSTPFGLVTYLKSF